MAKGAQIRVEGLELIKKKLLGLPKLIAKEIDQEMGAAADDFANRADADAPIDQGALRQGITRKKLGTMNWAVVSSASYSAYIEFGTKSRVKVPSEYTEFAAQFKGKGKGGGKGFYDSILAWVKRKGIAGSYNVKTRRREGSKVDKQIEDEQVAFAIYLSILRHGVHPHPFFLKQVPIVKAEFDRKCDEAFKRAIKK